MAIKKLKLFDKDKSKNIDTKLEQKTQELAHAIYMERLRNDMPGDAESDWAAAEKQILGKRSA